MIGWTLVFMLDERVNVMTTPWRSGTELLYPCVCTFGQEARRF